MNEPLIDTSQGPDAGLLNALAEAEADRDRARNIAVALEQEVAELEADRDEQGRFLSVATEFTRKTAYSVTDYLAALQTFNENQRLRAEADRYRREATVLHSVVEQAGLLVEHIATTGYGGIALTLRQILDGATFEEVRNA